MQDEFLYLRDFLINIRPNYLSYLYIIQTDKCNQYSKSNFFPLSHIKSYKYETNEKIEDDGEIGDNEVIENHINNNYNNDNENCENIDDENNQENIEDIKINDFLNDIKSDIINKFDEIRSNYKEFNIMRHKYNKIIQEYYRYYEHKIIDKNNENFIGEKNKLFNKTEQNQELFISKIAQDISFILSLSIDNKDKIKKLIEKDLKKNINEANKNIIESFLNEQPITNRLNNILNELMQIIKENDENNVLEKLNEKDHIIEFKKEIISINGIQKIYNDNEDEVEINEEHSYKDTFEDILDNFNIISNHESNTKNNDENNNNLNDKSENELVSESNSQSKIKYDNGSGDSKNIYYEENSFEISFLIDDINEKIKNAILLINLKLYYNFICNNINNIFINNVVRLLSKNIIKK